MSVKFCGSCGAPRRRPDQQFCSSCGVRYEPQEATYDPVVPAAPVDVTTATTPRSPYVAPPQEAPVDAAPWTGAPGVVDYAVPVKTDRPRGRRLVGVGALVLAVGAAGAVGWQVLGPTGGAASPEAAVEQLLTSVVEQDGVGLLSAISPGEVAGLGDVYEAAHDRLEEEGLVDGGGVTDAVELELSDLELETDELGERVARVTVTGGTLAASYDPGRLGDRLDFVREEFPDAESDSVDLGEVTDEAADNGVDLGLIAVEVDGGWYVSLLASTADLAYQGIDGDGGDLRSPDYDALAEDVVDHLVEAGNDGDVDALLAQLPEDLAFGMRPYARTIERALNESGASVTLSSSDLDLDTEELGGGRLKVTIDEAAFTADATDGYSYGGGTARLYDACVEGADYEGYGDAYCVPDALLDDLGIDRPYVVMAEVDGGYQLDPLATATSYLTTVVEEYPSSAIDDLLEAIETQDDEFVYCYLEDSCS